MTTTVYTGMPARGFHSCLRALSPPLSAAACAGAGCVAIWLGDPTTPGGCLPLCPTKALMGIDCPGCGGMRMLYSLLHGNIAAALHYNAVSFVAVLLFVWSMVAWAVGRMRGRASNTWLHRRWTSVAFAVVFVVWFVVRNLPFAPFTNLFV
jgi:hypothetical protein